MKNHNIMGSKMFLDVIDEKELPTIYHWRNDTELLTSITANPFPVALYEMNGWLKKNKADKNQMLWGIHEKNSGELIGIIRLMFIDWKNSSAELGIYLGKGSSRGKGYGTESLQLLLDFAFKKMHLHKIHLKVTEFNKRAIHLYSSFGFRKEGTLRDHFWANGRYHNVFIMGLLKNEYAK